ncbi:Collagenase-like protease, PrtC family [Ornithinibacillus halophilus]|uniref:Collagenase-like protease, PrtC family n=1 Tax=Ornithinibacillus halophilus TaxID=930117 RepID=A0A1M5L484_9BACI|nr:peptidase U32 family protein [Ornithinibacillus halophilus]SHG59760.1 Collagenase-like protease, PrtC family [Ornithinibacillus halophilus]
MIEIVATAESVEQATALVKAGVDTLYIGKDEFGLRLPASFTENEIIEITKIAHENGSQVCVAVNGLMHNDRIKEVVSYLQFLETAKVDSVTVGDPGVIHLMKKNNIEIPFIYDAQTLVTSAKHINFWAKRGAKGAVLARELTFPELKEIANQVSVPVELLVYGATCIHHSKRPLVENYYNFVEGEQPSGKDIYVSEPKKPETHYSIYEDINGTHVFATNDINLLPHIKEITAAGLNQWKLDGIFTRGERFVEIAKLFIEAKKAIESNSCTEEQLEKWNEQLLNLHPEERTLDEGFFLKDPSEVQ